MAVFPIAEVKPYVEAPPAAPADEWPSHQGSSIIIDNGATTLRAGWSTDKSPRYVLDNVTAKYRDRKTNRAVMLAGGEAYFDHTSRGVIRTPFEGDVVINLEQMENMLDYVFYKLGIPTESVQHPIVMSETLANPRYSRSLMSELLFEGYGVPSVAYGIDSLFSYYANSPSPKDGLVISSSTASSHVIPVLGGKGILSAAKKLSWGGSQSGEYMLKLMQLKYPTFPGRLTSYQSSMIYQEHCYHANDYSADIRALSDSRKLAAADRTIQFPFIPVVTEEKSEEELARIAEKKREAGKRLQDQAARQRLEKLVRQEEELATFSELKASKGTGKKVDYEKRLKAAGFSSTEDLEEYLKKIEKSLQRARNKELGVDENEGKEPPTFPLVNVPDHTLNEEDLKEKRRQRLMKAGYDARIRAKAERDLEKAREAEAKRLDEEARRTDPEGWLRSVRSKHEDIIEKIKERKKRKEQLSDRKSLAAQNRMKSIANLANEGKSGKKRKRGEKDDEFGKNDADWMVYREIGNADDSEDEEEEVTVLKKVEDQLLEYDPTFTIDHTAERRELRRHQLLNAFVRGLSPDDPLDAYDPQSQEHNSQLHLNVERIRVPEVLWQPHMAGTDQAGLGEIIEHVLRQFSQAYRDRLTNNVFVTGGNTLVPNFDVRLRNTIRPILPVSSPLNIVRPYDIHLDSWRGMAKWSSTDDCGRALVTKAEYDEYGGEWLKAHGLGNG
ncbi:actin-related protein 5 [Pseudohyphozyma bogoriensis]|nr:actin-related protein 5 [Pseudohyphozyma bogoriensis]